ncbi:RnfABCDGE type electron transport complex subunit D [Agarivorans sp. TSD2052]|uniref:RnfABCDGE type electron transport complex subunit D n=1 Tax=Agarivorans sp. TSD2052 TaxID=2937286 RepID=UPI002010ACC0|nr:RnfABCDGE type electron transport complex subunit D [Agarivorans sp. TSD2052]UPW20361.1 RnfABCDGE type electron transport complex subunit D [Agarivorans sp. TSD2052]
MLNHNPIAAPHTHSGTSTTNIMYWVIAALSPAALYGVWLFGLPALLVMVSCCVTAWLCELFCLLLQNKNWQRSFDGSAWLTALLLAMSLPPTTPWWIAALGTSFAILLGKQVYGGLGHNPFNPAMLGRVMLLICFPVQLTDWRSISPPILSDNGLIFSSAWTSIDGTSAATPLADLNQIQDLATLFTGQHAGSMGETSALLIALGGVFLIWRGIIRPYIPSALLCGIVIPAAIAHLIDPSLYASPLSHLFSGGAMLAAFFIATDMVTSPTSPRGQWVFGLACGLLIWLIRSFGSYPEGVAFAVLIMNACTPVIDHYLRPTIFGMPAPFSRSKGTKS